MTTPEILWLVHRDTIQAMRDSEDRKLRPYLIETGDEAELIRFDHERMKSASR